MFVSGDGVPSLQSLACYAIEDLVRKSTDQVKDPGCRNLISMTEEQQKIAETVNEYVENLCPNVVSEILSRVLSYNGDTKRKASPLDVWALMHPGFKKVREKRRHLIWISLIYLS